MPDLLGLLVPRDPVANPAANPPTQGLRGSVDAAAAGVTLDEIRARYAAASPLGRIADPSEIAATIVFLASPAAGYYTGQVFHPNGGTTTA